MLHSNFISRAISLLLVLCLCITVFPMVASADGADDMYPLGVSGNAASPGDTATPTDALIVAALNELPDEVLFQGYDCGEIESQADLILPNVLTGMDTYDHPITIENIAWSSDPAFDPTVSVDLPGYVFTPKLPEGYTLAEDVTAPVITVFIRPEGGVGISPLMITRNITTFAGLQSALADYGTAADDMTITVGADFALTSNLTIPANPNGKTLTITSDGTVRTLMRGYSDSQQYESGLFIVNENAQLILENIVIDGNKGVFSANSSTLICVNRTTASLELRNGAILKNNRADNGGGVLVDGGTFTMNGGEINGNVAYDGSAVFMNGGTFTMADGKINGNVAANWSSVYVNGTFTMDGGAISGNTNGGVYVGFNRTFTMNGGEINDNTSNGSNGGVHVASGGTFIMNDGKINGNTAMWGGGVNGINGTFIMNGGEISGNTANDTGGGVNFEGEFTMTGGEISDNTAKYGGGVYIVFNGWLSSFTMNNGKISGNTADITGGGVYARNIHLGIVDIFTMNGGEISGNTVGENGGGVAIVSGGVSAINGCVFTMNGGDISNNAAGQDGDGVYVARDGSFLDTNLLRLSGAPIISDGVYIQDTLSSSIFITGDLEPGARIVIEGSDQVNQVQIDTIVATYTGSGTLTDNMARAFVSKDGRLIGVASDNNVVWKRSTHTFTFTGGDTTVTHAPVKGITATAVTQYPNIYEDKIKGVDITVSLEGITEQSGTFTFTVTGDNGNAYGEMPLAFPTNHNVNTYGLGFDCVFHIPYSVDQDIDINDLVFTVTHTAQNVFTIESSNIVTVSGQKFGLDPSWPFIPEGATTGLSLSFDLWLEGTYTFTASIASLDYNSRVTAEAVRDIYEWYDNKGQKHTDIYYLFDFNEGFFDDFIMPARNINDLRLAVTFTAAGQDPCAAGHTWGAWRVTTPTTSTTSGLRTRTCTVCGFEENQVIQATGIDGGSSSDSSGGGGDGGSSNTTTVRPTVTPPVNVTSAQTTDAAKKAVAAAKASGAGIATGKMKNVGNVPLAALQAMAKAAGMPFKFQADSMNGNAVDVRITVDPAKATKDVNLYASTTSPQAQKVKSMFEKWFNNNTMVINCTQKGDFGMAVEIVAKIDPKLDTKTLIFYTYDSETNTYKQIKPTPKYWVDKNGYLHFETNMAGDIIITDKPLQKK